jgi:hypothetical protein
MNSIASTRSSVLEVVRDAAARFHERGDGRDVEGLEDVSPEVASLLSRELSTALDWVHSPEGEDEEADEMEGGDDYVSHDPVISTVQSAMDEHADEHPHHEHGKGVSLLRLIAGLLHKRTENYVKFVEPESVDSDVFDLPARCRVVLVGDWGTAKDRARRVAKAIAARQPDHIVHLGDVYPSGTRSRAHRRFIDVWMEEVGAGPKYWAMNGNHEMNANGEGYFLDVLPFCGQRASFFCLRNEHWKLIAIDSAYSDHDLEPSQFDWVMHQLTGGPGNNILLSHHQMFSAVDRRPARNAHKLRAKMQPAVDTGRIFGWFWGHEHRSLYYTRDPRFGNYLARCIGHGGKRVRIVNNVHLGREFAPPVAHYWNVPRPDREGRAMNGFALLTFDGPTLTIEYVDETGRTCFTEIWPDTPLV